MADQLERHRVRVWFGHHVIAEHIAEKEHAERYAAAMDRRFPGLKITDETLAVTDQKG